MQSRARGLLIVTHKLIKQEKEKEDWARGPVARPGFRKSPGRSGEDQGCELQTAQALCKLPTLFLRVWRAALTLTFPLRAPQSRVLCFRRGTQRRRAP